MGSSRVPGPPATRLPQGNPPTPPLATEWRSTEGSRLQWRSTESSSVGTGGQGPGSLEHTRRSADAAVSLLDIGALMLEVRPGRTVGYTFLDKHGSVLDRGTL